MQPDAPTPGPPQPSPAPPPQPVQPVANQTQPDYSFLEQQPKKHSRIPFVGNSLAGRIIVVLVCLLLIIVMVAIVKSLLTSKPFNSNAYLVVVERQHEMLHILTTDVTNTNLSQLSAANQNFVSTASLAIQTAQSKTVTLLTDYKVKVNSQQLAKVYDSAIDQQLTNSLSTNTFNTTFASQMQQQLVYYEQELKTSYASTNVANARSLVRSEFAEAKLLLSALSTPSS